MNVLREFLQHNRLFHVRLKIVADLTLFTTYSKIRQVPGREFFIHLGIEEVSETGCVAKTVEGLQETRESLVVQRKPLLLMPSYTWLILVFGEVLGESFHPTSSSQADIRLLSVV